MSSTAADGGVQPAGLAEGVEQRQAAHDRDPRVEVEQGGRRHRGVAPQVGVGELGPLGLPVVPEVYSSTAVSWSARLATAVPAPARQQPVEGCRRHRDEASPGRLGALAGLGGGRVPREQQPAPESSR